MKKQAFTVVEIVIALFLIVIVSAIFIPLNISNIAQAQRIAKWENTFNEARYSFDILKAQNLNLINIFESSKVQNSHDAFTYIKPYLNIDEKKTSELNLKGYKYKFLNGKNIKKKSKLYVDNFAILESGVLLGFKKLKTDRYADKDIIAIMLFDVNGTEGPNKFGRDIFGINIYKDKISPFGEGRSHAALKTNCSPIGTGVLCSKYYLIGGAF